MYKIIGSDGREYGPVSVDQLRQWIAEGRVNAQTRVRADDQTEWRPLSELPEVAGLFALPPPGASTPIPDNSAWSATVIDRDYQIDLGSCIQRGWQLVTREFGLLLGGTLLVGLVFIGLALLGMIPFVGFVGSIAQLVLAGPLYGGLYWLFLQRVRNRPTAASDVFCGFNRGFANLMLTQIVIGLCIAVWFVPCGIVAGIGAVLSASARHSGTAFSPLAITLFVLAGILGIAALCVVVYLGTCWKFSLFLAIDRRLAYRDAMKISRTMVRKHWWEVFGTLFVIGLVSSAGILACCVGILFTAPVAIASITYLYEDIFQAATAPGA